MEKILLNLPGFLESLDLYRRTMACVYKISIVGRYTKPCNHFRAMADLRPSKILLPVTNLVFTEHMHSFVRKCFEPNIAVNNKTDKISKLIK